MMIRVFGSVALLVVSSNANSDLQQDHLELLQKRAWVLDESNETGCTPQHTELNDDGGGNIVYLDRHNANCPSGSAMKRWRISRGGSHNRIRVDYNCCPTSAPLGSCSHQHTSINADGGGNAVYLDRHNVGCGFPHNKVMTQWRLSRGGTHDKMQIQYTCCDVPTGLDSCEGKRTPMNADGGGNSVYLDRHDVACPEDKVMTQWQLSRAGNHHQYQIQYHCCRVTPPTPSPTPSPTPQPTPAPTPSPTASPTQPPTTTTTTTATAAAKCAYNSCMNTVNKWSAKGKPQEGTRKACQKVKCQGCKMCMDAA